MSSYTAYGLAGGCDVSDPDPDYPVPNFCHKNVPTFTVDLTGNPDSLWCAPDTVRNCQCCGSDATSDCMQFWVTMDPNAELVTFQCKYPPCPPTSGPGAMIIRVECGFNNYSWNTTEDSAVCLSDKGIGPYQVSACKQGSDAAGFCIQSHKKQQLFNDSSIATFIPTFTQCLKSTGSDTMLLGFVSPDTIRNFVITFGDSSSSYCTPDTFAIDTGSFHTNGSVYVCDAAASGEIWYPGDTIYHTYKELGIYTLCVTKKIAGCDITICGTVSNVKPTADFIMSDTAGCHPFTTSFTNQSTQADTFLWDFGDGTTDTTTDPTHTFLNSSAVSDTTFCVKLIAYSAYGCSDTVIKCIVVHPKPVINTFTFTSFGCAPYCNNICGAATHSGSSSYYWDFGDNYYDTTTVDTCLVRCYTNPTDSIQIFDLNLTVVTNDGCSNDTTKQFTLFPDVNAIFSSQPDTFGCHPHTVNFENYSTNAATYTWDFGNGDISTAFEPTETFTNSSNTFHDSTYTVRLIAIATIPLCKDTAYDTIVIHPKPLSDFSVDTNEGCSPIMVTITNSSLDVDTLVWDFGDGSATSSNTAGTITHTYVNNSDTTKIYILELLVWNIDGCTDTLTDSIIVYPAISANFIMTPDTAGFGCHPFTVCFQNLSIGEDFYNWYFGDGDTDTTENPCHTFTNTDIILKSDSVYVVELFVSSSFGCGSDTVRDTILVHSKPFASFSVDTNLGYSPLTITITNLASGYDSLFWDRGDGTPIDTTTASVFTHVYINTTDTTLIYTLCLIAETQYGCTDTFCLPITVQPPINADFSMLPDTFGCHPFTVEFVNLSAGADSFYWNYGDGPWFDSTYNLATKPTHTFINTTVGVDTIYCVQLIAISQFNAKDTIVKCVTVNPSPKMNLGPDTTVCGISYTLDAGNPGASYSWSTGDSIQIIIVSSVGNYSVQVTASNGCIASDTVSVGFLTAPIVNLGADTTVFCGGNINLNAGFPAATHNWSTGETTQFINASSTGMYSVVVTMPNGCMDADTINVTIIPLIGATFVTLPESCKDSCNGMIDMTVFGGTPPYTFLWAVGDTTEDIGGLCPGPYPVTITDTVGCSFNTSNGVPPGPPCGSCIAGFNFQVDTAMTAFFNDLSSPGITSWAWDFGDSTTSIQQNPVHIYSDTGTYLVCLTVLQDTICSDTRCKIVKIGTAGSACFADFNFFIDTNKTVFFNDLSLGANLIRKWYFGDGDSANVINPVHTYSDTGSYSACLIIDNGIGCLDTVCHIIKIQAGQLSCMAGFNFFTDTNKTAFFSDKSAGNIVDWYWDFGDSTFSIAKNPVHTYASPGTYWVCLTITSATGCTDFRCKIVDIGVTVSFCNANFSFWADTSKTAYFTNTSTANNPPLSWSWDFGDSTSSTAPSPSHQYAASGSYWVCLTIENSTGCSETWCDVVNIGNVSFCSADLDYLVDTTNTVSFNDFSTGGITDWYWDFGDSTSSTQQNPIHNYGAAGTYWVCLTVSSDTNCTDTWCEPVVIDPNISCFTLSTSFINASCAGSCNGVAAVNVSGGTPPFTYTWDDPANSITSNVSGLCAGAYTVLVTDSMGCFGTLSDIIGEPAALSITINTTDAFCGTATATATATVNGGVTPYTYQWNDAALQTSDTATGLLSGNYAVIVTDSAGCTALAIASVSDAGGTSISVSANDVTTCPGGNDGSINITVTGGMPPYTYLWSTGDTIEDIVNLTAGNYSVTVSDSTGCIANASKIISEPADMSFTMDVTDANCGSTNGNATVSVSGGVPPYTYLWSTGGFDSTETGLSPGVYTVVITDANSCVDSTTATISNIGSATITAVITDVTCNGGSDGAIDMTISGGTGAYSIAWSIGQITEDISGLDANSYIVIVSDLGNGCLAANSFTVDEPDLLIITISSSDQTGCVISDGSATANVAGGTIPYSYTWTNGDSTETSLSLSAGTYGITVTDTNGCTASDSITIGLTVPVQNICLVTVDSSATRFVVVWKKSGVSAASYNIYKETATTNVYDTIGNVSSGSLSVFTDTSSYPDIKSELYKISVLDGCGNESVLSNRHKTHHLTTNLGAGGVVNLVWDNYEGFSGVTYRIWRGTTIANMVIIDSVSGSIITYTDTTPPAVDSINYQLELIHPSGCLPAVTKVLQYNSAKSNVTNRVLSDIEQNLPIGSSLKIYPNPYTGQTEITYTLTQKANVTLEVYNVLGKKVITLVNKVQNTGKYLYRFSGSENGNLSGIFILKLIINNKVYTKQLVELR